MLNNLKEKLGLNKRLSLLIPYFLISIFFIVTPLIFLIVKASTPISSTFNNWESATSSGTWKVMWHSIWTGLVASFIGILIGVPFAYFVAISKNQTFKTISIALMISPLFIFTIAKILALKGLLLAIFDGDGTGRSVNNDGVIILGFVYIYLPFLVIPIYSVFSTMPKSLIEASTDLGYSQFQTILRAVIPYGLKAILSGFALMFMLSATSIVVSDKLLTNNSGHLLIGNLINNHAHPSIDSDIVVSSTISLITIVVMSSIYAFIYLLPFAIRKLKGGFNV